MNSTLKSIYKAMVAGGLIFMSACQVTDLEPKTALSESTAFATPERIELAVAGVYDGGQSGFYLPGFGTRGYPFGAAHLQQGDVRGEDMISTQLFYAITYQNTYDPTSPNNGYYWQTAYAMINRANIVLDGVMKATPTTGMTQEKLDEYAGELRFLRAMAHHYLVVNWARPFNDNPNAAAGGIPYRETPITGGSTVDAALTQGRNSVTEVYDKILADLNYAEEKLPVTRTSARTTRATKGAAIAFKTRVRLHQQNWSEVITEGNKIVSQNAPFTSAIGNYRLTESPYGPFGAGNKSNTESIFSFENNDVDNAGVNGAAPSMYSAASLNGRGIIAISPILWNQPWFLESDLRKSPLMVQQDPVNSPGRGAYFSKKYADVTNRTDNAPIIRYAEVLLNLAEAITRSTGTVDPRAVELLNAVRNRAVTTEANQFMAASFAGARELTQAILNERRIEFVAEGMRWLDIHRLANDPNYSPGGIPAKVNRGISNFAPLYTGNPATTFATQPAIPYSDFRFVWPIPSEELINNPTLASQQNPNW